MHEAFGLRATLLFDLAGRIPRERVLAVLAGRAAVVCLRGFAIRVPAAIAAFHHRMRRSVARPGLRR